MTRRVFITGGSSGIGKALVERCAARGDARVFAAQRGSLDAPHERVRAHRCDVADARQLEEALVEARAWMGGLDVIVNNAGVSESRAPIDELSADDIDRLVDVNVKPILHALRLAPKLLSKGGTIVNVTSLAAWFHGATSSPVYAMTKHAAEASLTLTAAFRREHGIRMIHVCPGVTDTTMPSPETRRFCADRGLELVPVSKVVDVLERAVFDDAAEDASILVPMRVRRAPEWLSKLLFRLLVSTRRRRFRVA